MSERNWKVLMKQHDLLVRRGNATAYDRITILKKVWEDPQFSDDMRRNGKSALEELDFSVRDTCANFTELVQMLKLFPRKKQWETGDLEDMRQRTLEALRMKQASRGRQAGEEKAPNGEHRLSWKRKFLELEVKFKELQARHRQLEKDHAELRRAIAAGRRAS